MKKDNLTDLIEDFPKENPDESPQEGSQQVINSDGETITLGQEDSKEKR